MRVALGRSAILSLSNARDGSSRDLGTALGRGSYSLKNKVRLTK